MNLKFPFGKNCGISDSERKIVQKTCSQVQNYLRASYDSADILQEI